MDSRDATAPPPSAPPNMMVGHHHNSYPTAMSNNHNHNHNQANTNTNNAASSLISPSSVGSAQMLGGGGARFPFNSVTPPPQPPQSASKPLESLSVNPYDGSSSPGMRPCVGGGAGAGGGGFSIDSGNKKKRGRPRKYSPDGNIALGLSPTPIPSSTAVGGGSAHGDSGGTTPSSEASAKKHRGRPPGSSKKQLDALGIGGVGFTPHVIIVKAGEDIASKVMAFSQQGPRTVCVLSANGAICSVTLRQSTMTGGTITYEGRYEIISLSGSIFLSENNGGRSNRSCSLSVSLAGPDGRVLGGGVAGMLMAASTVQVIVGSFIVDGKKSNSNSAVKSPPAAQQPQMLNFGGPMPAASPSQGDSSESSDENGNSHLTRGSGFYNNASQPLHNMQMYQSLWAGQAQQ